MLLNFIRNSEAAFDEYCDGRNALLNYLVTKDRIVVPYFLALRNFEHCLAHLHHAVLCLDAMDYAVRNGEQYKRGDGSLLDRVRLIHNHVKHMDEKYEEVPIRDEESFKLFATRADGSKNVDFEDGDAANVPMWLTNDGLECKQTSLSYVELADEVQSASREAEKMAVLDPKNP